VAASLLLRYGRPSRDTRLRYWKPVQTGIEEDDDTATVRRLADCSGDEVLDSGVRLERPLSPHLAARLSGVRIDVSSLTALASAQASTDRWVVEGAGGVLVPLDECTFVSDLVKALGLPALVVARSSLGTINHTLLTLEALNARSIPVAGVIMVGSSDRDNREAIETLGRVPVIGELPLLQPLTTDALGRWVASSLDAEGRLERYLT
jgi:dethiobiotin synthetase